MYPINYPTLNLGTTTAIRTVIKTVFVIENKHGICVDRQGHLMKTMYVVEDSSTPEEYSATLETTKSAGVRFTAADTRIPRFDTFSAAMDWLLSKKLKGMKIQEHEIVMNRPQKLAPVPYTRDTLPKRFKTTPKHYHQRGMFRNLTSAQIQGHLNSHNMRRMGVRARFQRDVQAGSRRRDGYLANQAVSAAAI